YNSPRRAGAASQDIELAAISQRACWIFATSLGSAYAGGRPLLHTRHDERADRAVFAACQKPSTRPRTVLDRQSKAIFASNSFISTLVPFGLFAAISVTRTCRTAM